MKDTSFTSTINGASSILVLLPVNPTFDQVTAGLSFYLSLMGTKNISISCLSPMMVEFNRIIGINRVTSELGNKNLTIKFNGYEATNIEKVSYDIENGEFKLTVVPKSGFASPKKEQLDLSYTGISSDLVIIIGGIDETSFPVLNSPEFASTQIVHIGTRAISLNREILSFATPASSISELVASVIRESNFGIDTDIATNLIMGIEEESKHFESDEVTPNTFETFAFLLRSGGVRPPKEKLSPKNFPVGSIPTKPFTEKIVIPEGTQEAEQDVNPPADWLAQPKVYKGASGANPVQPDSFSENKG